MYDLVGNFVLIGDEDFFEYLWFFVLEVFDKFEMFVNEFYIWFKVVVVFEIGLMVVLLVGKIFVFVFG